MAHELVIIGTSGLAREVAQLARLIDPGGSRWNKISFSSDDSRILIDKFRQETVCYLDSDLANLVTPTDIVLGIGHPKIRKKIATELVKNPILNFPNLIHPNVILDFDSIDIGFGNMITQGVVMTCDIKIGNFNLFNWNVTVGHDSTIGSFNVLNPGVNISGWVSIPNACLLGTGSQVLEHRSIAEGCIIGAGAVINRSISEVDSTYVGVPGKILPC